MRRRKIAGSAIAIVILLFPVVTGWGQNLPSPRGYVNDFAGVIKPADAQRITALAAAIEQKTTIQVAVVTVKSYAPYGSIEQYSIDLASKWGIGQKGKDNGLMLIMALDERKARIEVGYGLEGIFTDGLVGRIMDTSMVPYFRKNDFSTGFVKAVEGIAGVIAKQYNVSFDNLSMSESRKYQRSSASPLTRLIPGLIFLVFIFLGGGRFFFPLIFLGGMGRPYYRGGFGSGMRGGFGGGGGFGGFGGGGFGGGGATRGF